MGTTECDKSTVRSNVGIAQCNNKKILNVTKIEIDAMLVLLNKTMKPSNMRKKVREPPNVRKKRSHVILKLHNVRVKPSNVWKKKVREPSNVRKELSYVILELHDVKLEPSNVRKKIREPPNMIKKLSHMTKELSHVTKKE